MNLRIIKAGVLDTLQDAGRYGWQHLGINPGGVMDQLSAGIANSLVGNNISEAVIELHFPSSAFFFEKPALIAISGADFSATVNGDEIPRLQPVLVSKYSILQFQGVRSGTRAYLAIYGGFDIEPWLNSYSTNLKAGAGGFKGRAFQKDDEIGLRSEIDLSALLGKKEFAIMSWKTDDEPVNHKEEILVLPGNEWNNLVDKSKKRFFNQSFIVSSQSDRMGYHLKGKSLSTNTDEEVVSSAVSFGTIQLLHDGQLIILMADHQTTGGYPRIAHVISAHQPRLAQMNAGDEINFRFTDQQTAEELFVRQQQHLLQLQHACKFKLDDLLNK